MQYMSIYTIFLLKFEEIIYRIIINIISGSVNVNEKGRNINKPVLI
jgi:hypothetical protein